MPFLPITQDDLRAMLLRTMDDVGWLQPLLDDPNSAAVVNALVDVFARLGAAGAHDANALTISDSSGGQPGTSVIHLARATAGTSGKIPAGYPFLDIRGVAGAAQIDVFVAVDALTVDVPVVVLRQTELANTEDDPVFVVDPVAAPVIDGGGVDAIFGPAGTVAVATTLAIVSSDPIAGAAVDMLSLWGEERGLPRQPGELERDYRARIRNVPDAVTPIAVSDVVMAMSQRAGLPTFHLLEPFDDGADPVLKDAHNLGSFQPLAWDAAADGSADFFDDDGIDRQVVDRRTATAYFEIVSDDYTRDVDRATMYFDDGFFDDPLFGYPDGYLTLPPSVLGALLAIIAHVVAVKPLGVNFDLFLREPTKISARGTTTSNAEILVWTLTPTAGNSWIVISGTAGHDVAAPAPAARHRVIYFLADGSQLSSTAFRDSWTQDLPIPHGPVIQIQGLVAAGGSAFPVGLVGQFRVHELAAWP